MGAKLLDPVLSIRRTTLPREAVALELERGEMSEELRVLYVAMTRAKEKLIAVAAVKNADKLLGSLSSQIQPGKKIAPYVVRSCRSISEWLLLCALRHPDGSLLRERAGASSSITEPAKERWAIRLLRAQAGEEGIREMAEAPEAAKPDEGLLRQLREKLDFQYPGHALSGIPVKVNGLGSCLPAGGTGICRHSPAVFSKQKRHDSRRAGHSFAHLPAVCLLEKAAESRKGTFPPGERTVYNGRTEKCCGIG